MSAIEGIPLSYRTPTVHSTDEEIHEWISFVQGLVDDATSEEERAIYHTMLEHGHWLLERNDPSRPTIWES